MILVRKTFERTISGSHWWFLLPSWDALLCAEALDELFEIPEDVNRIRISLHVHHGANRVRARVNASKSYVEAELAVTEEGYTKHTAQGQGFDRFLKPLVGKTVYVGVEYEE